MVKIGIQARSGSTRLPGKIYKKLGGTTVLEYLYNRLKPLKYDVFILGHAKDKRLKEFCKKKKLKAYFPDAAENDLLGRYAAIGGPILRVTSDCPLLPLKWVETAAKVLKTCDYVTNTSPRSVPDGHDIQGISKKALAWYLKRVGTEEHLFQQLENDLSLQTSFLRKFKTQSLILTDKVIVNPFHPENKVSIDTTEDLIRVRKLCQ